MPPKSTKSKKSPPEKSPKNKTKRCSKGEYRNPINGLCEKKIEKDEKIGEKQKPQKQIKMRVPPKNLSNMTIKDKKIFEQRKSCISAYRNKLPSLMEKISENSPKSPESKTPSPKK